MKQIIKALLLILPLTLMASETVVLTKENTLTLNSDFSFEEVAKLTAQAREMDKSESSDPIFLVLNSPGGYIDAGLEMIENLKGFKRPIKTITLFAASMGFQTVQGLGDRLITTNGTLMSHKARGGVFGEFPGQLDSRYKHALTRVEKMNKVAVARTNGKQTLESYNNLIENEFWCDGQECVDAGFADKIVMAKCDNTLVGTEWKPYDRFLFRGAVIEIVLKMDVCPLNTSHLDYNILIDGEPLFKNLSDKNTRDTWYESPLSKLDAEKTFELKSKVEESLKKSTQKRVIYGY